MGKLVIGPEGFVDMRRNPPATTETVNGWSPETDGSVPIQGTQPVEAPAKPVEALPGRQKTAEGLARPEAPVRVPKEEKVSSLKRIVAVDLPDCYAIVTPQQFHDFGGYEYHGTRSGHLYRRDGEKILWLHRECANCKRSDRFVAFRDGDQRNLIPKNLQVVASKSKCQEIKRNALLAAAKVH